VRRIRQQSVETPNSAFFRARIKIIPKCCASAGLAFQPSRNMRLTIIRVAIGSARRPALPHLEGECMEHGHDHGSTLTRKRLVLSIFMTFAFVVGEAIAGYFAHSLWR